MHVSVSVSVGVSVCVSVSVRVHGRAQPTEWHKPTERHNPRNGTTYVRAQPTGGHNTRTTNARLHSCLATSNLALALPPYGRLPVGLGG